MLVMVIGLTLVAIAVISIGAAFPTLMKTSDEVRGRLLPAATAVIDLRIAQGDMARALRDWTLNGQASSWDEYRANRAEAERNLVVLHALLPQDPLLGPIERAQKKWVADVADSIVTLKSKGDDVGALRLAFSDQSSSDFAAMDGTYLALRARLFAQRDAEVEQLHRNLVRLGGTLAVVALVLLVLVGGGWFTVRDWILSPLENLRDQLRTVARGDRHETPIKPSGPPELAAVAMDAEHMRRKIVEELDASRAAREALSQDAPGVSAIRRELLPDIPEPRIRGFTVHGVQQPAQGVLAGDWWDCIRLGDGRWAFCVADVAGHGPISGIAALRVKHTVSLVLSLGGSPVQVMRRIAETFEEEQSLFATVFLLVLDPEQRRATWVNAGHIPALFLKANGRIRTLDPTGPLLSTLGGQWHGQDLDFNPGDAILISTDGFIESRDDRGQMLGEAGLSDIVTSVHPQGNIHELVNQVVALTRERAIDWGRDDATLVGVMASA